MYEMQDYLFQIIRIICNLERVVIDILKMFRCGMIKEKIITIALDLYLPKARIQY